MSRRRQLGPRILIHSRCVSSMLHAMLHDGALPVDFKILCKAPNPAVLICSIPHVCCISKQELKTAMHVQTVML